MNFGFTSTSSSDHNLHYKSRITCESLDISKEYADILVPVNVYPVKLIRRERELAAARRLARYVPYHLLRDEVRQNCGRKKWHKGERE